jgi:hypothetical protein
LVFAKHIKITERFGAELRVEAFNIFNHPNFSNPDATLGNQIGNLGAFGLLNSTVGRPDATTSARQMQVALKLSF